MTTEELDVHRRSDGAPVPWRAASHLQQLVRHGHPLGERP